MPASTRHHRNLAVLVHCVGIATALPALSATAPAAATPPAAHTAAAPAASPAGNAAAPTTAPGARARPGAAPEKAVRVKVAPASTPAPAYRIDVRNDGNAPVETTVRQELPPGSTATTITKGGRASPSGGQADPAEVTWRLRLPARSTTTLSTALTAPPAAASVAAPACAFSGDGSRPYDCATATWDAAAARPVETADEPLWRRPLALLGALVALLAVTGSGGWWLRRRRAAGAREAAEAAVAASTGRGGTLYPRPAAPPPTVRRRRPPVWSVVGVAAVVLAGTLGTAAWTATRKVAAIDTDKQPTSGAWMGQGAAGPVGVPLRETAFEFTVYRVACDGAGRGGRQCQATVGVRNLTPEQQTWHGKLQRAYLPTGNWVTTDENATRSANQGRDVFAEPVAAGSRVVLPLVFTVNGDQPPRQLELRSGVFSAGVRVDVP